VAVNADMRRLKGKKTVAVKAFPRLSNKCALDAL
jgi:hypothetical protein